MPTISIEMFKERSVDQKPALMRELADAFVNAAGDNPEAVQVLIMDVGKADQESGGQLSTETFPG